MIELRTTNEIRLVTDNAGWVAFDEPGLVGQKVFFSVEGHGYEFAADGFGNRGHALEVRPGETAQLKVKRINVAERLYRVTGQGQFQHATRLGIPSPWKHPNLNAQVMGQDSTQAVVLGDRVLWTWGDTARVSYPLGNFATSGAWSKLPLKGGLAPSTGIDQQYIVDETGFSKPMFSNNQSGTVVWIHGLFTLKDNQGELNAVTHYSVREGLGKEHRSGIAVFDEQNERFEPISEFPVGTKLFPRGQAFRHQTGDQEYIYFATPYPMLRVPAKWDSVLDPQQYEAWTCLEEGANLDLKAPRLARTADGKLDYAWRKDTAIVDAEQQHRLEQSGKIQPAEGWIQTVDASQGRSLILHRGSVRWNAYLARWVMIANEIYGDESNLGEVYFLTSKSIPGRWEKARKIVTHNKYTFYNPVQHAFLDEADGKLIYFDGTYTKQFSATQVATPRYDYNTIMYRLDLSDERLKSVIEP
ncbi:hypothetical protein [Blastopirellula marina]|uniref:Uncharacterized protein n=1 Tax=Blastopirellula marina TaxID=124 RepID=A0A2S8GBW3_9BACT|nr:hypothetical protein [Blastopirellula marina]PQO41761.1 hypothetical protein C5Y98_03310 [Blastopirellula marina]PTL46204.1 hypothetical protein C5Y97_03310 [Blastopirellula marina]